MLKLAFAATFALAGALTQMPDQSDSCVNGSCLDGSRNTVEAVVYVSRLRGGDACRTAAEKAAWLASTKAQELCETRTLRECTPLRETELEFHKSILRCGASAKTAFTPKPVKAAIRPREPRLPSDASEILAAFAPLDLTPTLVPAILAAASAQEDALAPETKSAEPAKSSGSAL